MNPKTHLITGGTGALGGVVTKRLLASGDRVAATWLFEHEKESLLAEIEGADLLTLVRADVTDPDSVEGAVSTAIDSFGSVDSLVHLVGAWAGGEPMHDHSLGTWEKMLSLNLTSAFLCSRAVLPHMRRQGWGRIVLVSAKTARADRQGQAAYAIAKMGIAVLAETIAEENAGLDVTANAIAPSTLDTPANRTAMPDADHSLWVPPEEVAATIEFLTSDAAGQMRGAWLPVFGGAA